MSCLPLLFGYMRAIELTRLDQKSLRSYRLIAKMRIGTANPRDSQCQSNKHRSTNQQQRLRLALQKPLILFNVHIFCRVFFL